MYEVRVCGQVAAVVWLPGHRHPRAGRSPQEPPFTHFDSACQLGTAVWMRHSASHEIVTAILQLSSADLSLCPLTSCFNAVSDRIVCPATLCVLQACVFCKPACACCAVSTVSCLPPL